MFIRAAIVLLFLFVSAPSSAEENPLRVRAELAAQTLNVTQRTTLTVTAEIAQGWTLVDDPFGSMNNEDQLGPLQLVSSPRSAPARIDTGWTIRSWTIELSPNLPESGEIPQLRFKAVRIADERIAIERTEPISVVVESLLESAQQDWDPTALRPPLEPIPQPEQSNAALIISAGALAVLLAGAVMLTLVGKRRRDPERLRERRFRAYIAHVRAIDPAAPIDAVSQESHRVVRQAISELAGPRAMAASGADLPSLLRNEVKLSPTDAAMVCDYFARVDSAMYAGESGSTDDAKQLLADAQRAIESVRLACHAGRYA